MDRDGPDPATIRRPASDYSSRTSPAITSLTLTFGGDVMSHLPVHDINDYEMVFSGVTPILQADDLSFANLETPVDPTRPVTGYPRFNTTLELVQALIDAGIDVLSVANNHSLDQGIDGFARTVSLVRSLFTPTGTAVVVSGYGPELIEHRPVGRIAEAGDGRFAPPAVIYKRGWTIAFFAVTEFSNEWPNGGNIYPYVSILDGSNREEYLEYLAERSADYDLVILSYHGDWVEEYHTTVRPEKEELFYRLLDAGVHIVWGHHPHVLQPWRLVNYYGAARVLMMSAGNFVSAQGYRLDPQEPDPDDFWADTHDSTLFRLRVRKVGNRTHVESIEPIPVFQWILPDRESGVITTTYSGLDLWEVDPSWQRYYDRRLNHLQALASEYGSPDTTSRSLPPEVVKSLEKAERLHDTSLPFHPESLHLVAR